MAVEKSRFPGQANPYFIKFLYFIGQQTSHLLFDNIWRRRIYGRENIPPAGTSVVFAANHRSNADPNLVGSIVPYPIHYFAKDELFKVPLVGWYIRRVNAFPVKRGEGDVGAFKTALRILRAGEALLLFPEGGRRLDPRKQFVAKSGVGMLAMKSGAVVVPVGVRGSDRFSKLAQVDVVFGRPMQSPPDGDAEAYQRFSDQVMREIRALCEGPLPSRS